MSHHYNELRDKLGLNNQKEEKDDIFNDPIPFEDQYPSVVIKHLEEEKAK